MLARRSLACWVRRTSTLSSSRHLQTLAIILVAVLISTTDGFNSLRFEQKANTANNEESDDSLPNQAYGEQLALALASHRSSRTRLRHRERLLSAIFAQQKLDLNVTTVNATGPSDPQSEGGRVTAAVIASVGRTGSTILSNYFARLPQTFLLVEPDKLFFRIDRFVKIVSQFRVFILFCFSTYDAEEEFKE